MSRGRGGAALALAAILIGCLLILPDRPAAFATLGWLRFPLELPLLLGMLVAVSAKPRTAMAMRVVIVAAIVGASLLRLADQALWASFSRPFNPVVDMFILSAGVNLLRGSVGDVAAVAVLLGAAFALLGVVLALGWATGRWSRPGWKRGARRAGAGTAAIFAALVLVDAGRSTGIGAIAADPPGEAQTTALLVRHAVRARGAARDLTAYRRSAQLDRYADAPGLFDRLDGRDVIVVFIESYGRTSFSNPLYAPTHVPTLAAAFGRLDAAGLASRSLWLTSPVEGGQSWLAHGTFASGLRTSDQARYGAMLTSPRRTLYHLAAEAGYRTAAIVPAITLPWPEGPRIGFETVLAAADLDYAGQPFNWVTMPDQYTLDAYSRLLGADARPDFLEIALISSHAPWVPIPPLVPWEDVGDGRIFDRWANSGDPPSVVWRDRDRVRDQYRQAIDYSLQVVMDYAARGAGPDAPLLLVLGDHPPAGFVSQVEGREVPLHLIGPPEVLALFDGWGATGGLLPGDTAPVWPMESFRDRFLDAVRAPLSATVEP